MKKIVNSLENYCKLWDQGGNDLTRNVQTILTELERLQKENKRLSAEFTGELTQSPLEMIRAKCEQYWNEPVRLCPEEMHNILGFIHRLAISAEKREQNAIKVLEAQRNFTRVTGNLS